MTISPTNSCRGTRKNAMILVKIAMYNIATQNEPSRSQTICISCSLFQAFCKVPRILNRTQNGDNRLMRRGNEISHLQKGVHLFSINMHLTFSRVDWKRA